ncbi:trichohyalin isoform X1, partial [Vespula squamosa]
MLEVTTTTTTTTTTRIYTRVNVEEVGFTESNLATFRETQIVAVNGRTKLEANDGSSQCQNQMKFQQFQLSLFAVVSLYNILDKFNPGARQLINAGKAYLKALHGRRVEESAGLMEESRTNVNSHDTYVSSPVVSSFNIKISLK